MSRTFLSWMLMLFPLWVAAQSSADVTILPDSQVAEAQSQVLRDEARLFQRVRDGVMLTLAECELVESCEPSVGIPEVENILLKLDIRITTLTSRYMEESDPTLEQAILMYADAREDYVSALDTLQSLGMGTEDPGRDDFGGDLPEEDLSDLFQDADEDL